MAAAGALHHPVQQPAVAVTWRSGRIRRIQGRCAGDPPGPGVGVVEPGRRAPQYKLKSAESSGLEVGCARQCQSVGCSLLILSGPSLGLVPQSSEPEVRAAPSPPPPCLCPGLPSVRRLSPMLGPPSSITPVQMGGLDAAAGMQLEQFPAPPGPRAVFFESLGGNKSFVRRQLSYYNAGGHTLSESPKKKDHEKESKARKPNSFVRNGR